jgi:outer membrane protein assembly factor BamB
LRWTADLGGRPVWVGYLDEKVLAATDERIIALKPGSGEEAWRFEAVGPAGVRQPPNPFEPGAPAGRAPEESAGKLQGFRCVGGRVICLRGDRQMVALDGETGQVDWTYSTAAASINPNVLVTPTRLLVQVRKPNQALVLDPATGRPSAEFALGGDEDWLRPPLPIDEDHVVLVPDRRTVALFDVTRGVNGWVFRESQEMPKNGPPRPFGDAERLLLVHDGGTLIRLDAATGEKRWSRPLGVENLSERPQALALDGGSVYWINNRNLNAASLADGALAWTRFLSGPEAGWGIELTDRNVLAYPLSSAASEGEMADLPLVLCRRGDGTLVQRLLFSAPTSEVAVRRVPGSILLATQAGAWSLVERTPVDAHAEGR